MYSDPVDMSTANTLPSFPLTMLYSVKSANNKQAVRQGK